MLTKRNPDSTWSCQGVDFGEINGNVYGALCKLRDYEKSRFEPDDLDRVIKNIHIGSNIQGYVVFGVWNDCCIAENHNAPEPFIVWAIDGWGVRAGKYFENFQQAQKCFYHSAIVSKPDKKEYWKK
ncbi:MAG: hypothetical protein K2H29_07330 [Oscillospiraceae bacterium]|nr:hypothetical protein [Oscillospiraceae bacterium]